MSPDAEALERADDVRYNRTMTTLPLEQNAVISACGKYRYVLTRQVRPGPKIATFIMLNPSTADATQDDPTIRRCIGFARQWGCWS